MFISFPFNWFYSAIGKLPAHMSLNYFWNFGSLLGIILVLQTMTGIILSFNYLGGREVAFIRVLDICQESFNGIILRVIHLNGASMFFLAIYLHLARGLYFASFRVRKPWLSGNSIIILLMATAFLGYVLPWGQISLWGAIVITNLVSAIPVIGKKVVFWVWGGFRVNRATLGFFYSAHFLLPFVIICFVLFHIIFLHERGSTRVVSIHSNETKVRFNLSFSIKDIINLIIFIGFFIFIFLNPYLLGDPENFIFANPLISPVHIQPEWYFLFAYAILRAIPNKLGGVLALVASVVVFYLLPFLSFKHRRVNNYRKFIFHSFIVSFLLLTWLGGNPVEAPYIMLGQLVSFLYFLLVFLFPFPLVSFTYRF